jgi:hypothetical protein
MIINRYSSFAMLTAFAIVTFAPVFCLGQMRSSASADVIGDSVAEFSNEQGKNGWYYGYWDLSTDADGKYNQLTDFKLLKNFGTDARNGLSRRSEFTIGDVWYLEDGRSYTSLWAKGGHANSAIGPANYSTAEQWVARRWISDTSGTVTISGHAGKVMPWGANWDGECQATIFVDGEVIFSTVMDEHGLDYSVAIKVREKSMVDFLIAPNPSIGVVTFTAAIRKRPTANNTVNRNGEFRR